MDSRTGFSKIILGRRAHSGDELLGVYDRALPATDAKIA